VRKGVTESYTEESSYYKDVDVLLRCTNQSEADKYVDYVLGISTKKKKESIIKAFFQVSKAELRNPHGPRVQ